MFWFVAAACFLVASIGAIVGRRRRFGLGLALLALAIVCGFYGAFALGLAKHNG